MSNLQWILLYSTVVLYYVTEISTMRCEDSFEKNHHYYDEMPRSNQFLKEFLEMKSDIESLRQKESVANAKDLPMFDIRYDEMPEKCRNKRIPYNCGEATACIKRSGYYYIRLPEFSNDSFLVECDARTEGGDWTVIQRRHDGSVDFYRTWSEYKVGFGNIDGEFFIGLDKLHALTNYNGPQELLILLENGTNTAEAQAKYDDFSIGDESEKYFLKRMGHYTGTAGDSLKTHFLMKFSTKDQDNDKNADSSCATAYLGAWWYNNCHSSNLNGHYGDSNYGKGLSWFSLTGHTTSAKYVKMMLRRRRN